MRKILCTGGRSYSDRAAIAKELRDALYAYPTPLIVLVGDAKGADRLVREWCEGQFNVKVRVFHADWDRYGHAAGPMRNQAMVDERPDCVYAFPGGRGTADCVFRAEAASIKVYRVGAPESVSCSGRAQDAAPEDTAEAVLGAMRPFVDIDATTDEEIKAVLRALGQPEAKNA